MGILEIMLVEERNAIGELKYSIGVSLNHIDLSEYSSIEGDFTHMWQVVLINVPCLHDDKELHEVHCLVEDFINPKGEPLPEVYVDKEVRSLVNHFLMTL